MRSWLGWLISLASLLRVRLTLFRSVLGGLFLSGTAVQKVRRPAPFLLTTFVVRFCAPLPLPMFWFIYCLLKVITNISRMP